MTNYTCTTCSTYKNTAGYPVCHDCLFDEIHTLNARLSKYEQGIPCGQAKNGNYYSAKAKAFPDPIIIYWNDLMQAWSFSAAQLPLSDDDFEGPFHPIAPALESQSGEVTATNGDHQSREAIDRHNAQQIETLGTIKNSLNDFIKGKL